MKLKYLLYALIALPGIAFAQTPALVNCIQATSQPCVPNAQVGNGTQGMPAWQAFGTLNQDNLTSWATLQPALNGAIVTSGNSNATTFGNFSGHTFLCNFSVTNAAPIQCSVTQSLAVLLGTSSPSLIAGSNITITGTWPNQTISATGGGGGGVSSVSGGSANGFNVTVANPTTTPAISIAPTYTGISYCNGATCAAAIASNFPTLNQSTTGNAGTATAFASTPAQCAASTYATGVTATGAANCSAVALGSGTTGTLPLSSLGTINPGYVLCNSGSSAASPAGCPTSTVRYATATTLTIAASDNGGVVSQNNSSAVAASIAQSNSSGFPAGSYQVIINNTGTGTITITPTTSTINGGSTATIAGGTAALLAADNTSSPGNYLLIPLSGGGTNASFGSITIPCSGDTSGATDTATIQAALNNLTYSSTTPNSILLAGCKYYINAALIVPNAAGFYIHGTSREGTIINQVTNNTPIFEFTGTTNNNNFDIGYMTLQWSNNQTFTQTNSIAFWFNGGASYQAFNFSIHHFQFVNGYRGISQNTTSPVWGMTLSDGIAQPTMVGSIVNLYVATVGQPNETIRNVYINCYGTSGTASNEPAIQITNNDNVLLEAVEFNSGSYSNSVPQLDIETGGFVTLVNVKSEFVYIAGTTNTTGSGAATLWRFINENVVAIGVKSESANITGGTSGTPVYAAFIGEGAITWGTLSVNGESWQELGNYASYLPYTQVYSVGNNLKVTSFENYTAAATGTNGYAPFDVAHVTGSAWLAPSIFADNLTPDTTQTNGDSSLTLTLLSARRVWYNATLTANRTLTLPTCTAESQEFDAIRKAATPGAFTLTTTDPVSGFSEVIAANTNGFNHWRCTQVTGTYEWIPTASGTL